MKFNMKDPNPGTWFYFNEDNKDDGGVCLRTASVALLRKIEKECTTERAEFAKPFNDLKAPAQRFSWFEFDEEKAFQLRWDYCIVDWKNLTDSNGNQIACTTENKILLMGEHLGFSQFILTSIAKLSKSILEETKVREKNSLGGSKDISPESTAKTAE